MAAIAKVQTQDRTVNQLQQNISQAVKPLLDNPISSGAILSNVSLVSGANVIPHGLGRTMQGWSLTDIQAAITYYRSAAFNDQTLTITASGSATVNLYVF